VSKYSSNGRLQWKRQLGTYIGDSSNSIATDSRGNAYLTGYTIGKLGDRKYGDEYDYDAWAAKYNSSGSLQWKRQLGTPGYDISYDVATDSRGNVYLTGETADQLGDQQYGGYSDAWVAKYKP
jgi:hypothetical protein